MGISAIAAKKTTYTPITEQYSLDEAGVEIPNAHSPAMAVEFSVAMEALAGGRRSPV